VSVYLIRHGESAFNVGAPHPRDPLIFDAPLTQRGQMQAERMRETVQELGIKAVICSPLTRAIQTALCIFDGNVPITIDATHRELLLNSYDVGRPPKSLASDFPGLGFDHLCDHWWHNGPTNENNVPVEPPAVFYERARAFDRYLAAATQRPIAIVGHGNFFRAMIGRNMDNCEIERYEPGTAPVKELPAAWE
jgi:glucosyl-3-phosphoglycerate phosphatase